MSDPIPMNADKRPEPADAQGPPPTAEQIAAAAPKVEPDDA